MHTSETTYRDTPGPSLEDYQIDFEQWTDEMGVLPIDTELLVRAVLDEPEEPQTAWIESNPDGTVTEEQYRQQCYWVIGQFGHALDVIKDSIMTEAEAQEWFEMKMSIAAAKSETDFYKLATIRSECIPIWNDYIQRMNIDYAAFERVCNK